jgi:hypothetical protein
MYSSRDKVGAVYLIQYIFENPTVNINALCTSCEHIACCSSQCILTFLYAGDNIHYEMNQFVSCTHLQQPTVASHHRPCPQPWITIAHWTRSSYATRHNHTTTDHLLRDLLDIHNSRVKNTIWRRYSNGINTNTKCLNMFRKFQFIINTVNSHISVLNHISIQTNEGCYSRDKIIL